MITSFAEHPHVLFFSPPRSHINSQLLFSVPHKSCSYVCNQAVYNEIYDKAYFTVCAFLVALSHVHLVVLAVGSLVKKRQRVGLMPRAASSITRCRVRHAAGVENLRYDPPLRQTLVDVYNQCVLASVKVQVACCTNCVRPVIMITARDIALRRALNSERLATATYNRSPDKWDNLRRQSLLTQCPQW